MSGQYLGLDLNRGAESDRQMRLGIDGSLPQQLVGEGFGLLGSAVSLLKVIRVEGRASSPRESFEVCSVDAMLGAISLQFGICRSGISLSQGGANVVNDIGCSK